MSGELRWPPSKEDLERLYLAEKLSAAKIARLYGLKHPNPKSSETLVLYHLKRFGIKRRDKAEHVRKVTEEMVDEWVRRYQAGESLKQIASAEVSPVTVFNHLRKCGVQLRDKVEAQIKAVTKHARRPFSGDENEKWYLLGLSSGDFNVVRHGRAIRVRVSTTHPAMADLFESLFSAYGYVHRYPRRVRIGGHEWTLESDLDETFGFLLHAPRKSELFSLSGSALHAFLAGLWDAEGSIYLHNKRGRYNPETVFVNTDGNLIDFVFKKLSGFGLFVNVDWRDQAFQRGGIVGESRIGRATIWRFADVQSLLRLMPFRHREKKAKAELVLEMTYRAPKSEHDRFLSRWLRLQSQTEEGKDRFIQAARMAINGQASFNPNSVYQTKEGKRRQKGAYFNKLGRE
ncbi:MAG: LAGLIDADG family homing endonuclease [Nitrososphaerales archaeon]|nr:LAGLIDADG family homing endonuclease [Nitrososphaerales archaeon]